MFALFLGYVLVIQRAVEQAFGGQFGFAEPLPPIHVLVWIHPLLPKQVSLLFVLCVLRCASRLSLEDVSQVHPVMLAESSNCK